jgi:Ni/Co efflux regulator RcnB
MALLRREKDPTKGDGTMKYWLSAIMAACLVLAPMAGQAAAKKIHRSHRSSHMQQTREANPQRTEGATTGLHMPTAADPTGGNAAVQGNNATSMFGTNSAADNAIGRTNGGGGFGGQ